MKQEMHLSEWRSPDAEQRFRDRSDALADDLLTDEPTPIEVDTRLGPTVVWRWEGDADGVPVVLLHGTGGIGITWAPYAAERGDRPAYAVDTIGDVGRSKQVVPVTGPDDLAEWLDQTLAGLGLDRVHLCGTSYGGFLALNLAARRPERVCSLFLIEPVGIAPVRIVRFMVWGLSAMTASVLPGFLRRPAARRLRMPALEDERLIRLAFYAARHHRTRLLRPEPLSDDELASIAQPVTMILGAKSEVMRTEQVRSRAERHLRRLSVEIVPDAGHAVQLSAQDHIVNRLWTFASAHDGGRPVRERTARDT